MRRWQRFIPLALLLANLAWGAKWYYEPPEAEPAELFFEPTAQQMLCASLLNPLPGPGVLTLSNLPLPSYCPSVPPVVVYAKDNQNQEKRSIHIAVKFWGKRFYQHRKTGVNNLIRKLKSSYSLRFLASGDLVRVHPQYLPPLISPTTQPSGTSWIDFIATQDLSLDTPHVTDAHNYTRRSDCPRKLRKRRFKGCWSAVLHWQLPIREVLQGTETGTRQVQVKATKFNPKKKVKPLSLQATPEGKLEPADEILPLDTP